MVWTYFAGSSVDKTKTERLHYTGFLLQTFFLFRTSHAFQVAAVGVPLSIFPRPNIEVYINV